MGKFIDLTGQRFGKLIVKGRAKETRNNKICWICDCDCGNKNEIKVGQDLRRGHTKSCGHCGEKRVENTTIIDLTGKQYGRFTVLELFPERTENRQTQWKCICNDCKKEIIAREGDLVFHKGEYLRCDCHINSKGEEIIKKFLIDNKIPFECQKTFSNCKFKDTNRPAFFDFYVNGKYLIEYDGEQHFKYRENGWNTKENFEKIQYRDNYKTNWCFEQNIPLIRIPYTHLSKLCLEDLLLNTSQFVVNRGEKNE